MEVVAGGERAGGPFSRRNVQEWSRLDQLTGLLEHARVETDHWATSTSNSSHHFGKVVDSRSRNLADGGQEQRHQTKQLEVFQANIPGGSVQVIRSSTSSSWQSHKTLSGGSGWSANKSLALPSSDSQEFDHLKLALHPLDLSSQKTKASIGRSGSIGSRRPPSRPRSIVGSKPGEVSEQLDDLRLTDISKICQKVHEEAKKDFKSNIRQQPQNQLSSLVSCDSNDNITNNDSPLTNAVERKIDLGSGIFNEVLKSNSDSTISSGHLSVFRKKSCSSEDLHVVDEEDNATSSSGSDWRRSSKVRRSLQFPSKQALTLKENIIIPVTKTVAEIKKEIEARKQLVTNSFRTNHWNSLAELEDVLGVVGNGHHSEQSKDSSSSETGTISPKKISKKRQTFITAETLQEVKGRLRKLNSPVDKVLKSDDVDDGIVTEVKPASQEEICEEIPKNTVKSYVYGMEVLLRKTKPSIVGTGSLESRSSNKSVTNGNSRSEEWYNRRKSYGFEQVSNQQNSNTYFEKSKIESSTDSGICKSSDTFPSWQKLTDKQLLVQATPIKTSHSIAIKPYDEVNAMSSNEIGGDAVIRKGRKTVVNLTSSPGVINSSWSWSSRDELLSKPKDQIKESIHQGKASDNNRSFNEKSTKCTDNLSVSEPITISIPIIQQPIKSNLTDPANLLLKETTLLNKTETSNSQNGLLSNNELLLKKYADRTMTESDSIFDNIPWRGNRTKTLSNFFDSEFKRHSIAVDQTKYLTNKKSCSSYHLNGVNDFKTEGSNTNEDPLSYAFGDKESIKGYTDSDQEQSTNERKQKKVEFCKTEVHFAAEPGRFNIVETDGKPPPTNMYRRRRKTTPETSNRSGLPEIRFGDTQYEQNMLLTVDCSQNESGVSVQPLELLSSTLANENEKENHRYANSASTVPKSKHQPVYQQQEQSQSTLDLENSSEDDGPKPKSILKNNIPKPKPYLLGELPDETLSEDSSSWGVRLKSVKPDSENQIWPNNSDGLKETEFQKLLKSLRPSANNKPPDLFQQPEQSSSAADNGLEVRISSSALLPDHRRASWSVADRVRHVEETRGYSTKVNFGPQETTVVDFKANDNAGHCNSSDAFKNNWLIKEQHSPFDNKPAEQEPYLKSVKKLTYSQSFNVAANAIPTEKAVDQNSMNILKSTSLVLGVQNPSNVHLVGSEKKISTKEMSTNIVRDSKNFNSLQGSFNKSSVCSDNDKVNSSVKSLGLSHNKEKGVPQTLDTNTIPQTRKTSSSTQTYFVNRKAIKNPTCSRSIGQINSVCKDTEKIKEINGMPGVLNALDDLSRCIDEVIIESPRKVCKQENITSTSIFKVKEDYKVERGSPKNILNVGCVRPNAKSQLDLLREIVDTGDVSDDSLKADEEVRAYMSADNDDTHSSEWSGSWSRLRTLKQHNKQEAVKDGSLRQSPNFELSPIQHRHKTETAVKTQMEPSRVTSICLRYEDKTQPTTSTTKITPSIVLEGRTAAAYVSRSFLNTAATDIASRVEQSSNGDRSWRFTKASGKEPITNEVIENKSLSSLSKKVNNRFLDNDKEMSPSRFSRNSQSPTKESLFLERTAERNILYNENNRQMSSSPTSGTSGKTVPSSSMKFDKTPECSLKNDKITHTTKPVTKVPGLNNAVLKPREDKIDCVKRTDAKRFVTESKPRERRLSTSSSGRDGWLNTPKETPARKKSEAVVKKQDTKKELKTTERSFRVNGVRNSQKRTESPIYQNRDMYAERRDSNDNTETESTILEELTKAADQILLAVNGYTDDDSYRASSEDESRKRRERISQPLCTISELPNKKTNSKTNAKTNMGVIKSTRSTDLRREYHSSYKNRIVKTASNSSLESSLVQDVKPLLTPEDRSKRRAARLLQRASSRELLFQTAASSSEDIGSGSDTGSLRTKRVYRRSRLQNGKHSGSKNDLSTTVSESRTKERVLRATTTNEVHKRPKTKSEADKRCSRHSKISTGISMGEQRERRPLTHSSRIQKKKSEASQLEGKSGGVSRE